MKIKTIQEKLSYAAAVGTGIFLLFFASSCSRAGYVVKNQVQETVVVSQRSDPYYSLAQKIAQAEGLEIVQEFAEVLKFNPKFIMWVASPQAITKERLLDIGRIFKSLDYYPGFGIISGSTIEKAEQLWMRKGLAQKGKNYLGGDVEPTQWVYEPTIFNISDNSNERISLDKAQLIDVLKQADYFYWSRHVGKRTWFWNAESEDWGEDDQLFAKDIPPLKPVVIYTPSCNSFRPWVKDSIALGFVDQGAAAYIGNINSPFHTNALLRRGLLVPGMSSWKEFPLGLVAQVESKVAAKAYFSVPQFFMLGDPRIYLSKDRPYHIISDTIDKDGKRVIEGESSENGILAVKIEKSAEYNFLAIPGLASVSENDPFHNNKLQTLNLGSDKYALFLHRGGHFEIELSKKAPFWWWFTDLITDILDYAWVVLWLDVRVVNAPFIYAILLPIAIVILLWKMLRQKKSIQEYQGVFLAGFLLTLLRLIYCLVRMDDYSVSANLVNYTASQIALGCVGVFACASGGLMLMKDTNKSVVKTLGLVFAALPQFLLSAFYLVFITFMNAVTPINDMTVPWLWNYNVFWLSSTGLFCEIAIILALYRMVVSAKFARQTL
jgi:hypothetical protein